MARECLGILSYKKNVRATSALLSKHTLMFFSVGYLTVHIFSHCLQRKNAVSLGKKQYIQFTFRFTF